MSKKDKSIDALDYESRNNAITRSLSNSIYAQFPIEGNKRILRLKNIPNNIEVDASERGAGNFPAQKEIKLRGKSWDAPVYAHMELIDKETGKIIDSGKLKIGSVPQITDRFSTIIDGSEYQTTNQFRLKSGIYTRMKENGQLESTFNLAKGFNFKMELDPTKGVFYLTLANKHYELYSILKGLEISDSAMQKIWGSKVFAANQKAGINKVEKIITELYKKLSHKDVSYLEAIKGLKEYLDSTEISAETTKITLGKSFEKVTPEAFLAASGKLLRVMKGEEESDERDSLTFKDLYGVEDLLQQYFDKNSEKIIKGIKNRIDVKDNLREIISSDTYGKPIKSFFTTGDLSSTSPQTNPMEMVGEWRKTTIMGTGGIQSRHAITTDARNVHPSHIGFLDPLATPDGFKVGTTLPLSGTVIKSGKNIKTRVLKNGLSTTDEKLSVDSELLSPAEIWNVKLGFPDEFELKNGKVTGKSNIIKGYYQGKVRTFNKNEVEYFLYSPNALFSQVTNLIPFLSNTQGNRGSMGARMLTQAMSLKHREAPLVQSVAYGGNETWDKYMGEYLQPEAAEPGIVTKVTDDYIKVKYNNGKEDQLGLYNYFPLNQNTYLHSTPNVKKGDKIKKGQILADHNYSKNQNLAIGTNMKVAYMPWKGYNFEDGIVITEAAAKKLTSLNMYKKSLRISRDGILDKKKFRSIYPDILTPDNFDKLDPTGIVKEGAEIEPGEVMVAYLEPRDMSQTEALLKKMSKIIHTPFVNRSLEWDKSHKGTVKYVRQNGRSITIHVLVENPMGIADKLSGRYGNKGVITKIIPDDEAPHTKSGERIDVMLSPAGVPGRVNPSQILETAAGKLAEKTGKIYKVKNFEEPNSLQKILGELKKNNIETEETLLDGKDGKPFDKKVFIGNQFMLRLAHDVEKKMKARYVGSYDQNMTPGTGKKGGQKMDAMTMYSLLSHGAKENLSEMSSIKGMQNDELWRNLQLGLPLPTPKENFAWDKMIAHLQNVGVNVEKKGNEFVTSPFTDKQLKDLSAKELKDAGMMLVGKNLSPIKEGLFDPEKTGGMSGSKWSYIKLNYKIPHPIFEKAIQKITKLTKPQYDKIMAEEIEEDGLTGATLIEKKLKDINVKSELRKVKKELSTAPKTKISSLNKRYRYLKALDKLGMNPEDYMIKNFPVMPPKYRPIYPLPSGDLRVSPINKHYRNIALVSKSINDIKKMGLNDKEFNKDNRVNLYRTVKEAMGLQEPLYGQMKNEPGLITQLTGKNSPKEGFIQEGVWQKRQDVSGRSTITVEPSLPIDEAGIPIEMAKTLYKPFVVREMVHMGLPPIKALKEIKDDTELFRTSLRNAMEKRPVLINRAPSLHKHSIQAWKPVLVEGKDIKMNPLTFGGLNLDLDGDSINSVIAMVFDFRNSNFFNISLDPDEFVSSIKNKNINLSKEVETILKEAYATPTIVINVNISEMPYYTNKVTKQTDTVTEYEVPDFVKVFALENGKQVLKPVTRFSIHKNLKMFRVETGSKRDVIASEDHSLICYNSETGLIEKMKPEHSLNKLTPIAKSLEVSKDSGLNEKTGWFIGAIVGDGWTNIRANLNAVMLANSDAGIIKEAQNFLGEDGYSITNTHNFDGYESTSTKMTWTSKYWASYFREEIGHGATNKHLPRNFLFGSEEYRLGLLAGLIDTDGSVSKVKAKAKNVPQYVCSYTTISKELQYQVQQLCASLGVRTSVTPYTKKNLVYNVYIYMTDLVKLKMKIKLRSKKKADVLEEAFVTVDRKDIVPIKFELAEYIQKNLLSFTNDSVSYAQISKARKTGAVSRAIATKICDSHHPDNGDFKQWRKEIVKNNNVSWDIIKKIEPSDETIGYDMTVPGPYVFMLSNLMTVQDTMSINVPVTDAAVDEAWGMVPSKNLYLPTKKLVPELSKQYMWGAWYVTKEGKDTRKKYLSVAEAVSAGLKVNDMFTLGTRKTSIGRELFNSVLPPKYRNYKKTYDSKELENLMQLIAKESPQDFGKIISSIKDISNRYSHESGSSSSITDLVVDPKIKSKILKKWESSLGTKPSINKIVDVYGKAKEELKKELKKDLSGKNTFYDWVNSGALGKEEQLVQMIGMPGILLDTKGNPIPVPIKNSYTEGLDSFDYWNSTYGVRSGTIDRAVNTQDSGALNKRLLGSTRSLLVLEEDCKTTNGIEFEKNDKNIIDRTFAKGITGIGEAGDVITPEIADKIKKSPKIKTVLVRSPLTCETSGGVCQKCYGLEPGGQFPDIGDNVGIKAAQAVTERSTQLVMKTFHTGGAASGGNSTVGGFKRVEELFKVPQTLKNKATLAEISGQVQSIRDHLTGGKEIYINGMPHITPRNLSLVVKVGDHVNKGDRLTVGSIKPQELANLKDFRTAQRKIVDELDDIYGGKFYKKTFETAVRGISDNAEVTDPGSSNLLIGDRINTSALKKLNTGLEKPVKYNEYFKSIDMGSDDSNDWVDRLTNVHLKAAIQDMASTGMASNIHGTNPMPGYLYGLEFNKDKKSFY